MIKGGRGEGREEKGERGWGVEEGSGRGRKKGGRKGEMVRGRNNLLYEDAHAQDPCKILDATDVKPGATSGRSHGRH